jgi:hypothetical protein
MSSSKVELGVSKSGERLRDDWFKQTEDISMAVQMPLVTLSCRRSLDDFNRQFVVRIPVSEPLDSGDTFDRHTEDA